VIPDLGRLIERRQDELRGRCRDWGDDFGDWRRRIDWTGVAIIVGGITLPFTILILVLWLS